MNSLSSSHQTSLPWHDRTSLAGQGWRMTCLCRCLRCSWRGRSTGGPPPCCCTWWGCPSGPPWSVCCCVHNADGDLPPRSAYDGSSPAYSVTRAARAVSYAPKKTARCGNLPGAILSYSGLVALVSLVTAAALAPAEEGSPITGQGEPHRLVWALRTGRG